jgi:formamidopyrimidine-DNA glycosylase
MPELPEVETVRRTLQKCVLGANISGVTVLYDPIVMGQPAAFAAAVAGQNIRAIERAGKYLVFVLDEAAFTSHLRMEGKYNIVSSGEAVGKHEHVLFALADGRDLRYQDVRKFGRMTLTDKNGYRRLPPLDRLGPEPWEAEPAALYEKLRKSRLPLKSLLLDQTVLAGIGNIYANEICFSLRLDPRTPGHRLTAEQCAALIAAACAVLDRAIELGGTTVHSFTAGGVSGRFQNELAIHGQNECPHCHGKVAKIAIGGRGTYFCQNCQK